MPSAFLLTLLFSYLILWKPRMAPVLAIRRAASEAQAELDRLYAAGTPTVGSALDQLGLRDGMAIVEDFLDHGEMGLALEHLLYMVNEPSLHLSPQSRADIAQAASSLGLLHLIRDKGIAGHNTSADGVG
jgi:hypothetical protein